MNTTNNTVRSFDNCYLPVRGYLISSAPITRVLSLSVTDTLSSKCCGWDGTTVVGRLSPTRASG